MRKVQRPCDQGAPFNVLVSSVGRRAQLVDCWRKSTADLGLQVRIIGVDCARSAPAAHLVDEFFVVPRCTSPEFPRRMLEVCRRSAISVLVPTIDTELPVYAHWRQEFERQGTMVAISSPEVIAITTDKARTYSWLVAHGFPAPRLSAPQDVMLRPCDWTFPLVFKPRCGSASIGVRLVDGLEALEMVRKDQPDGVVQEYARGYEYTVNVLVNRSGRCVCAVPHRRCQVRAGEVSKGITLKHPDLMELARRIAEELPGSYGALNIQMFLSPEGGVQVTEVNARFGGGYPLAYEAGAHFPRWMVEEIVGLESSARFDAWTDRLAMLRYDNAIFLPAEQVGDLC